jgi:hypothetical protein
VTYAWVRRAPMIGKTASHSQWLQHHKLAVCKEWLLLAGVCIAACTDGICCRLHCSLLLPVLMQC